MKETITLKEAAQMFAVCPNTIRKAVKRGEFEGVYGGLHKDIIKGITRASAERLLKSIEGRAHHA